MNLKLIKKGGNLSSSFLLVSLQKTLFNKKATSY